jgi:hypothetical protein
MLVRGSEKPNVRIVYVDGEEVHRCEERRTR